jgi:hypothetical protein
MSDLESRYNKSPELRAEPPEPAPVPEPTAEELFLKDHPELEHLRKEPASATNRGKIIEAVKGARLAYFKEQVGKEKHEMTPAEVDFASQILAKRIEGHASPRILLDGLEGDLGSDYNTLVADILEVRRLNAKKAALGKRYSSSMNADAVTVDEYLRGRG